MNEPRVALPARVGGRGRTAAWVLVLAGAALVVVAAPAALPALREAARWLYGLGSAAYNSVAAPLNEARLGTTVPLLAPLLLGLMAAASPCQLSTGAAALAYVARDGGPNGALRRAGAYLTGRVLVYAAVGAAVMYLLGGEVLAPGAFLSGVRRVLGPLMLLMGLVTLGVLRPRFRLGGRLADRAEAVGQARGGAGGAFALGLAFSLAFCPTLFLLFFGLTVPLALTAPLGFLYPAVFALGITLPLLGLAALLASAAAGESAGEGYLRRVRRWNRLATPVAGAVFVLAGVYDTFVYWLL